MSRRKKRRGISLGTIAMLMLTILVLVCAGSIFPKLMGNTVVSIDASVMLEAMNLSDGLPELSLSDIPIISVSTSTTGGAAATYAPQTPAPTGQPVQQQTITAAPTVTPLPTPTPYAGGTVTLTLGGSVHMDAAVRQSGYYSESKKYDFSEILMLIDEEMQSDLTMLSLENLIMPEKKVSDLIAPTEAMEMLNAAGVDIVALGFPQAFDQGAKGLASTVQAASDLGIAALGAYISAEDGAPGRVFDVDGVSVGFLHYTQELSSKGAKAIKKADAGYAVPVAEAETIAADIAALRGRGVKIIVVSVNWNGSKTTPSKTQTTLCQQIADAGADVIVGTGTGIVQPVVWLERSNGAKTLCAYSLGALLSESRSNGGVAAMLLQLKLIVDGSGSVTFDQAAYTPTYIWRYKQDGKYYYRVVASDQPAPDGMDDDQQEPKERALTNLQKYMGADSVLTLRTK